MTQEAYYVESCIACGKPMKVGDKFFPDVDGGYLHAECLGDDREGFVDMRTGDQIPDDAPIPQPQIWADL